jgi:hypothetical protein
VFGLSKLTAAIANLAASLNGFAAVVDAASGRLRQHLALEDHTPPVVIESAVTAPPENVPADEAQSNGRKRKATTAA